MQQRFIVKITFCFLGIHALRFRNCLRDTVINMFWPSFPWPAIPSGGSFLRRLDQESPEVQAVKYYFEQTNATKKKIELVAVDQVSCRSMREKKGLNICLS